MNKLSTVVCKLYKIRPQSNLDFQGGANATVALLDVTIVSSCLKREPIPFKHRVEFEHIFEHLIATSGFEKNLNLMNNLDFLHSNNQIKKKI